VVHPAQIGGDEYVGRSTLFDLLGERRACLVACHDLDATGFAEGSVDVVERVLQGCRGKHGDLLLCDQWLRRAAQRGQKSEQTKKRKGPGGPPGVRKSPRFGGANGRNRRSG